MSSIISTAVSGINSASSKIAITSGNIAGLAASDNTASTGASGDTASQLTQLNIASYDFKANVKVLELAQEDQKRLIDLIG